MLPYVHSVFDRFFKTYVAESFCHTRDHLRTRRQIHGALWVISGICYSFSATCCSVIMMPSCAGVKTFIYFKCVKRRVDLFAWLLCAAGVNVDGDPWTMKGCDSVGVVDEGTDPACTGQFTCVEFLCLQDGWAGYVWGDSQAGSDVRAAVQSCFEVEKWSNLELLPPFTWSSFPVPTETAGTNNGDAAGFSCASCSSEGGESLFTNRRDRLFFPVAVAGEPFSICTLVAQLISADWYAVGLRSVVLDNWLGSVVVLEDVSWTRWHTANCEDECRIESSSERSTAGDYWVICTFLLLWIYSLSEGVFIGLVLGCGGGSADEVSLGIIPARKDLRIIRSCVRRILGE